MNIPFVDLQSQYQGIKKEIDVAVGTVLSHTKFIQGPEVSQFEKEFAKFIHAKECIGLNSGTDALILGIRALGLTPHDEIILPVNTFIATALGISENKLKPVFVDIDKNDYGMDLEDLKKKITPRTKAIIVVHLFGQPEKIDEIKKIIRKTKQKIYLIEDACQAHGAKYKGKRVGTFGIFSAFSFYPGKNLGAYGDGGAIVTNSATLAKKCRMLREYGQEKKYVHKTVGINSRLDTLQAAILLVKLKHLEDWNKKRQKMARYYSELLREAFPKMKTPLLAKDRLSVFHLYVVEIEKREALLRFLHDEGVQALIHYPIPLHMQAPYKSLGYKKGDFPNIEYAASRILSLPMFPELTQNQAKYVVNSIKKFYEKR